MKSIFEQMGGTYTEVNGYLIPDIEIPTEEETKIGIRRQRHLRLHQGVEQWILFNLDVERKTKRLSCRHRRTGKTMYDRLMKQLAERKGITEKLKAENQMLWVDKMNAIHNAATEIVDSEFIFN